MVSIQILFGGIFILIYFFVGGWVSFLYVRSVFNKLAIMHLLSIISYPKHASGIILLLNNYFGFSDLAYYGIYGATGLLFGILAVWLEKVFIVIATSLIGSLMFLLGKCPCNKPVT